MLLLLLPARLGRNLFAIHTRHFVHELAPVFVRVRRPRALRLGVKREGVVVCGVILGRADGRVERAGNHGQDFFHGVRSDGLGLGSFARQP